MQPLPVNDFAVIQYIMDLQICFSILECVASVLCCFYFCSREHQEIIQNVEIVVYVIGNY